MKRATILILALLLTMRIAAAQDTFPPDADEIFTDAVEVLSVEVEASETSSCLTFDNETRIVHVFNETTQTWREFPYPDDLNPIVWCSYRRIDGLILIAINNDSDAYTAEEFWLVNPSTGAFTRAETVCDEQVQVAVGEGQWRFVTNPDDGRDYLCFTETGELSAVLPESEDWFLEDGSYSWRNTPAISPDGEWLVLGGYGEELDTPYLVVYSYHITSGELILLGRIDYDRSHEASVLNLWVSDTMGTVSRGSRIAPEEVGSGIYSFDVTQANSLQYAFGGYLEWSERLSRWEYLRTDQLVRDKTGAATREHLSCALFIYDAMGVRSYELGYDCARHPLNDIYQTCVAAHQYDDVYYYLRFDGNSSGISTVMRLDASTGESVELFRGEIESLAGVSPDGRYLTLVVDNSGQIERVDQGCNWYSWDSLPNATIFVYDTQTNDFIYQTETIGGLGAEVYWLDDNALLLVLDNDNHHFRVSDEGDIFQYNHRSSLRLITWDETTGTQVRSIYQACDFCNETFYGEVFNAASPNSMQVILNYTTLVDFRMMTLTAIFCEEFTPRLDSEFIWNTDDTIRITLPQSEGTVIYTIRVMPQT